MTKLKKGMVVRSRVIVTDVDRHDQPYIHAVPGTYGVIISSDEVDTWPNVKWGLRGEGGVCNITPDKFEVVGPTEFETWQAVDFKYED